jgi:hypothetical protein
MQEGKIMHTSTRLISSRALLALGVWGLVGCYGEAAMTEQDLQPVEQAGDIETGDTGAGEALPAEQTPAEDKTPGEQARIEPTPRPEQEPQPDAIVNDAPALNVLSVTCVEPNDEDGMDEPMLIVNGHAAWADAGFVPGTTAEVPYDTVAFDSVAVIELWELDVWDDYTDPNDLVGYLEVPAEAIRAGPQITTIEGKGVAYEISYQVEPCTSCQPGDTPELR